MSRTLPSPEARVAPGATGGPREFLTYRLRGSERRSPLPGFYIRAHAAVEGLTLVTRDARRYRTYFPTVELLTPPA